MSEEWTPRKAVEFAVVTEELGEKLYQRLAKKFEDQQELVSLFKRLAGDEALHRTQFETLLSSLGKSVDDAIDFERAQYLRAMSISEFFSRDRVGNVDEIKDVGDALQFAFAFEKAVVAYLGALQDVLGDNAALKELIDTEKQHVTSVMKYMVTGAKMRGLGDTWA